MKTHQEGNVAAGTTDFNLAASNFDALSGDKLRVSNGASMQWECTLLREPSQGLSWLHIDSDIVVISTCE